MQDIAAFEISARSDTKVCGHDRGVFLSNNLGDFLRRPGKKPALLALALRIGTVGVGGGIERAAGRGHVSFDVLQNLAGRACKILPAGRLIPLEVDDREQRVVVEHFFKVWHEPFRIGRVAMKAPARMIIHAARRHFLKRRFGHLEIPRLAGAPVVAKQDPYRHAAGKLGSAPRAAVGLVVARAVEGGCFAEHLRGRQARPRNWLQHRGDARRDLLGPLGDLIGMFVVGPPQL